MNPSSYREAGVDIDACDGWLEDLQKKAPAIGGFAGLFAIGDALAGMTDPCIVSSTDGVGTKLMVAQAAGDLSTIGVDCVAMVVNDLLCMGARPLLFLDYLAVEKFDRQQADEILKGIIAGCEESGCSLVGGETAELPGLLAKGRFDIAGFAIGLVDRKRAINGSSIQEGDCIIGLASTGVHSNGFSLVRKAFPEFESDAEVARRLLTPTRLYVKPVMEMLAHVPIRGIAHITGGGIPGNLSRVLPGGLDAHIDRARWTPPAVFTELQNRTSATDEEMFRTFNMGIGLCLVCAPGDAPRIIDTLPHDWSATEIGSVKSGSGIVTLIK